MVLNTYSSITQPTSIGYIPVNDWLQKIKSSEFSTTISDARIGLLDYNVIKAKLPAVTWNFIYNEYKKDDNCIYSTNFLFIDVDSPEFDINTLDLTKIYSFYRSFGGKGYGIIVKTKGITYENFKESYTSICLNLGIQKFIDKNAVKQSQYSVLSFDSDIYINKASYVFDYTISDAELKESISDYRNLVINKKSTPSVVNKKKEDIYDTRGAFFKTQMRYDNTDTIDIDGNYIVNWEGYTIVKAWIPMQKIPDGNRYNFFLGYANNLVSLNPTLTFLGLLNNLKNVNCFACVQPIAESQLVKISNTMIKQRDSGILKPIEFNKKRKIVFSKDCKLDKESKLAICRSELAKHRSDGSRDKIYQIIENWDFSKYGKITQPAMVASNPISRKTVQKYWSEFKEYVSELNQNFKK